MNKVTLFGRLTKDPESRQSQRGTTVTTVILATDRVKLDEHGKTYTDPQTGYTAKEAEFHKVTVFNGVGKAVAEHKRKGDQLAIVGRLHYTRWEDRDGVERFGCEIIAEEVHFA